MLCGVNWPYMSEHSIAIRLPSAEEPTPYVSLIRSRWKNAQGSGYKEMAQADSSAHRLEPEQGHLQLPALCNWMAKKHCCSSNETQLSSCPHLRVWGSWTDVISWVLFLNDSWKQSGVKALPRSFPGWNDTCSHRAVFLWQGRLPVTRLCCRCRTYAVSAMTVLVCSDEINHRTPRAKNGPHAGFLCSAGNLVRRCFFPVRKAGFPGAGGTRHSLCKHHPVPHINPFMIWLYSYLYQLFYVQGIFICVCNTVHVDIAGTYIYMDVCCACLLMCVSVSLNFCIPPKTFYHSKSLSPGTNFRDAYLFLLC